MSTNVGNIAVTVGANVGGFVADMGKAGTATQGFDKKLSASALTLAKYAAAAVAAGAATATALYAKGALAIDSQAKLARAVGGTTAGVQALTRASDLSGVSQEAMATSSGKLNQKLGEAIRVGGAAADELNRLGLSAQSLAEMDADQRMAAISDRLVKLGYDSTQAGASLKNLGIRNNEITAMMLDGGDAIRAARTEIEAYGVAISDVDAAKVEAANDAMTSIALTMQGISNQIAVALAPYVQALGERIGEAAKESKGFGGAIGQAIEGAVLASGKFGDVLQGLKVTYAGLKVIALGFSGAVISAIEIAATAVTYFIDKVLIGKVNLAVDALNMLPNVDIAKVNPLSQSGFMDSLHALGDSARNSVGVAVDELSALAMQPMPSEQIKKFLDDVAKAGQESAEKIVSARQSAQHIMPAENEQDAKKKNTSDGMLGNLQEGTEAMRQELAKRQEIAQIYRDNQLAADASQYAQQVMDIQTTEQVKRAELLAAYQLEVADRATQREENLARLAGDKEAIAAVVAQYDEQEKLAEEIKQSELTGIQEEAQLARERLRVAERSAAIGMALGLGQQLMSVTQGQSRKAFEFAKKTAVASAVIDGYRSATAAWSAGMSTGGPWAPAIAAGYTAASLLKTGGLIQQIKGSSFGGGGGAVSSAGGGGDVPTPATAGGGGGSGSSEQSGGTYRFEGLSAGSFVSSDMVVEMLKQAQKDGALRGQISFAA